jgi:hypothetical protein
MKRREFLKSSLAAGALAGLNQANPVHAAEATGSSEREYYELRVYRLKNAESQKMLDDYLEKAAIPALNRLGVKTVGAFTEMDSKDGPAVYVLIPHASPLMPGSTIARFNADEEHRKAGAEYLQAAKSNPVFERIDSWLLLAFAGLPKLNLPAYCRDKKPRVFEMRTYESYSEVKAIKKVEMFNAGEIEVMKEVGLGPIFYGQALVGRDLPHLTYMLSAESQEAHKKQWADFLKHPTWNKMKNDPQYADTVSKITSRMLAPTLYSQI